MKKTTIIILSVFILLGSFIPSHVAQAKPIVPDCGKMEKIPEIDGDGKPVYRDLNGKPVSSSTDGEQRLVTAIAKPCDFNYLMELVNNVIDFLIFVIATPLVAIVICYAGFKMITSGGSSEAVTTAKKIMGKVLFGYIAALAAWLVINSILAALGFNGPSFFK